MKLRTAESVTQGHPDKLADLISDTVLDAALEQDPQARTAVETFLTKNTYIIGGEISTTANLNPVALARAAVTKAGYPTNGITFLDFLTNQSPDIAAGVLNSVEKKNGSTNKHDDIGAGDQGIMYGYATNNEAHEHMPLPIMLAHALTNKLTETRAHIPWLRPDGKAQVTLTETHQAHTIVLSAHHAEGVPIDEIRETLTNQVILPVIGERITKETIIKINPTGTFTIGGPEADAGLTGRKIIVDTYGGAPHGGGAFSGKDPTKVDRSGAYYARFIAKHIVAAGLARTALVKVAYIIGVANPVHVEVDAKNGRISNQEITSIVKRHFDARPAAIIEELNLRRPIYAQFSSGGHFGRKTAPWEQLTKLDELRRYA